MPKKLYVGNMPYQTTEEELEHLFGQYGSVVSASIVMDRVTGRSRGFAFVEMEEDDAASAAIAALDNKDFNGRELRVSEARERAPRNRF